MGYNLASVVPPFFFSSLILLKVIKLSDQHDFLHGLHSQRVLKVERFQSLFWTRKGPTNSGLDPITYWMGTELLNPHVLTPSLVALLSSVVWSKILECQIDGGPLELIIHSNGRELNSCLLFRLYYSISKLCWRI